MPWPAESFFRRNHSIPEPGWLCPEALEPEALSSPPHQKTTELLFVPQLPNFCTCPFLKE
jgi:hypothetical protein